MVTQNLVLLLIFEIAGIFFRDVEKVSKVPSQHGGDSNSQNYGFSNCEVSTYATCEIPLLAHNSLLSIYAEIIHRCIGCKIRCFKGIVPTTSVQPELNSRAADFELQGQENALTVPDCATVEILGGGTNANRWGPGTRIKMSLKHSTTGLTKRPPWNIPWTFLPSSSPANPLFLFSSASDPSHVMIFNSFPNYSIILKNGKTLRLKANQRNYFRRASVPFAKDGLIFFQVEYVASKHKKEFAVVPQFKDEKLLCIIFQYDPTLPWRLQLLVPGVPLFTETCRIVALPYCRSGLTTKNEKSLSF